MSGANRRPDKQEEYKNLVEQRNTYMELKQKKFEELEELKNAMRSVRTGSICSEEIYPVTTIQIEQQKLLIDRKETDCNILLR